jgi:hypothetical protein
LTGELLGDQHSFIYVITWWYLGDNMSYIAAPVGPLPDAAAIQVRMPYEASAHPTAGVCAGVGKQDHPPNSDKHPVTVKPLVVDLTWSS